MAARLWFCQIRQTSLDRALPLLLEKTYARKWRSVVRLQAEEHMNLIDSWLWTYDSDSFLPHAIAAEDPENESPILLTLEEGVSLGANALFVFEATPSEADDDLFSEVFILFNGHDEAFLRKARTFWKRAKDAGRETCFINETQISSIESA